MLLHNIFALNPNFIALLLACGYCLLQGIIGRRSRYYAALSSGLFMAALTGNILLQSVTGIAALLMCAWYWHGSRVVKKMWWVAAAAITAAVLCINTGSVQGRWHILRTSAKAVGRHFPRPVPGFAAAFNHEQADYFRATGTETQAAWLADEGRFAMNEWLQLMAAFGWAGLLLMLILHIYFLQQLFRRHNNTAQKTLTGMLLPFYVFFQCSYPLHQPLLLSLFVMLHICLLVTHITAGRLLKKYPLLKAGLTFMPAVAGTCLCMQVWRIHKTDRNMQAALAAWNNGNHKAALQQMQQPEPQLQHSAAFILNKAQFMQHSGYVPGAVFYLQQHHQTACCYQYHILLGKCRAETGNYLQAEQEFITALYMVPHKLAARYQLMALYQQQGNTATAAYWARQLDSYRVKSPSAMANFYKQAAAKYLLQF